MSVSTTPSLPDTDVIILYDIPANVEGKAWSPNTWKTRIALNYKGLPYRTEWVEYPDIAPLLRGYGIPQAPPPAWMAYTLPAIYDPKTRSFTMDSMKIAVYLDATYPDTPAVLPASLRVFHGAFQRAYWDTILEHLRSLIMLPALKRQLNERSQTYFRETREKAFACKMEEICPPEKQAEQWARLEKAFGVMASWFEAAGDGRVLFLGTDEGQICHADTQIGGLLKWIETIFGPESEEWRRVEGFDDGRWKRFMAIIDKWADTSR